MKYDKKTGQKIPENRRDEVAITMDEIKKMYQDTNGMVDQNIEHGMLLRDINISLALIVDILAGLYNKRVATLIESLKKGGENNGQDNGTCSPTAEYPGIEHDLDGSSQGDSDIGG